MLRVVYLICLSLSLLNVSARVYAEAKEPLNVVTSFSVLADWVKVLGGQQVRVNSLVGMDEDVHVFHASPSDLSAVAKADLVLINGLGLEGWIARLIEASGFEGKVMVASAGIAPLRFGHIDELKQAQYNDQHGHHHGDTNSNYYNVDPHAWLSPKLAKQYVDNIAEALKQAAPNAESLIEQNRKAYQTQLDKLDAWTREGIAQLPENRRQIVVPHTAFGYFQRDYGITFLGLQGVSTKSESSAAELAHIVRMIRAQGIDAIFTENTSNRKLIERIASETDLALGGVLVSGALSDKRAPNYLKMMEHNVEQILGALN